MRLLARLGWLVLMSGLLVALFAGSFYITMRVVFVGREVMVPDLAGLLVDEARATLNRSELYLETAAERYDDRVLKGRVQSQDPPAGATITKNRKVRVTVSLGPLEIAIPDLKGQTLRTAQKSRWAHPETSWEQSWSRGPSRASTTSARVNSSGGRARAWPPRGPRTLRSSPALRRASSNWWRYGSGITCRAAISPLWTRPSP